MPTSSVAIKSKRLDIQALHRVRERLIKELGNELRGILAERGYVMRRGKGLTRTCHGAQSPDRLSDLCRTLMLDHEQWRELMQSNGMTAQR